MNVSWISPQIKIITAKFNHIVIKVNVWYMVVETF